MLAFQRTPSATCCASKSWKTKDTSHLVGNAHRHGIIDSVPRNTRALPGDPPAGPSTPAMSPLIPESFSALVAGREAEPDLSGDAWLRHLPALMEEAMARWDLSPDGDTMHGVAALVLPVPPRHASCRRRATDPIGPSPPPSAQAGASARRRR